MAYYTGLFKKKSCEQLALGDRVVSAGIGMLGGNDDIAEGEGASMIKK